MFMLVLTQQFIVHGGLHLPAIADLLTLAYDSPLNDIAFYVAEFLLRSRQFQL